MDWSFIGAVIVSAAVIFGWLWIIHVVFTQSERALRRQRELEDAAMRQATVRNVRDIVI